MPPAGPLDARPFRFSSRSPSPAPLPAPPPRASRAFSGAVSLSLVDEGVLSLNDTIGERLPYLPRAWHRVTLRELLAHTSGLPDFSASKRYEPAVTRSPAHAPPPRRLLDFVAKRPLRFTPGSEYAYSNSDNIAVGLMVER